MLIMADIIGTKQLHDLDKQQGETLEKYCESSASTHKEVGIEAS